jgi:hypothetical protein
MKTLAGLINERPWRYNPSPNPGKLVAGFDSEIHFASPAYVPSSGASEEGVLGKAKNITIRATKDVATIAHSFCLSV